MGQAAQKLSKQRFEASLLFQAVTVLSPSQLSASTSPFQVVAALSPFLVPISVFPTLAPSQVSTVPPQAPARVLVSLFQVVVSPPQPFTPLARFQLELLPRTG